MHALGVDHFVQKSVLEEISQGRIDVLFAAPPCGAAGAARNIKAPGVPWAPKPLRSPKHPYGLPWIRGLNAVRSLLRGLYSFCSMAALPWP